jgi:hypothetical protein
MDSGDPGSQALDGSLNHGLATTTGFLGLKVVLQPLQADYQLAFRTPGMRPSPAMLRKQMRQMPNLR